MDNLDLPLTKSKCGCPTCGLRFNSASAFDKHRVGLFMPNERRCLSEKEMLKKGMAISSLGYWVGALNDQFNKDD